MKIGWIFFLIFTNCGNMFLNFCRVCKFKVELCLSSRYIFHICPGWYYVHKESLHFITCSVWFSVTVHSVTGKKIMKVVVRKIFPWRLCQCVTALVWPGKYKHQDIDFSQIWRERKTLSSFTLLSSGHYDCCDPKFSISRNNLGKKIQ